MSDTELDEWYELARQMVANMVGYWEMKVKQYEEIGRDKCAGNQNPIREWGVEERPGFKIQ